MSLSEPTYILLVLAAYQLLNRISHRLVKRWSPSFYATLENDRSRKLAPYFVFPLGILLTLISTPACLVAYNQTPPESDTFGTQRPFSTTVKICLASRGTLWVSELPLLSYSTEYITHHILSLGALLLVLVLNMPRRPIYLIYAGLVTELFLDTVALLRLHGRNAANSSAFRRAMLANVVSMVILRILPITVFVAKMEQTSPDFIGGVGMYCVYLLRLSFLQLRTLGFIESNLGKSLQARFLGNSEGQGAGSWMPRPMTLVLCAAVAIVSLSASEHLACLRAPPSAA